jgi:hypothetical protein
MTGAHEGPPWASEAREAVALPYIGRHRPPLARLVEDQPPMRCPKDGKTCTVCTPFSRICGLSDPPEYQHPDE